MRLNVESLGQGRDLALLHGWGMHSGVWRETALELARDFRVHLVDLPGHGRSRDCELRDLNEVTRAIAERFPDSVHVSAWSLGALIALAWVRSHPKQVRKLALIAATPSFAAREDWPWGWSRETLQSFERDLLRDPDRTFKRFLFLQVQGETSPRKSLRALRQTMSETQTPSLGSLAAGLRILKESDLRKEAGQVAAPTLVMHGDRDAVIPVQAARWLAAQMPNASLRIFSGCGHAPFLSRHVAGELGQFFHE